MRRNNIDICPFCGKPFDEYWGYKFFVGGTKPVIICEECYRNGQDKADVRVAINVNKAKRRG